MSATTLAGVFRPSTRLAARLYDALTIGGASLAMAFSAQLAIPLPFTPVPVTLQTLVVLLSGALLGGRRALLAVALLLAEGAAGMPVFSGWRGGLAHLGGPTGGYLLGFALAAFVTGCLAERGWDRTPAKAAAAMLAGSVAMYAAGLVWLASFVGAERVLELGLLPFIPGDVLKLVAATALLPLAWRAVRR